MQEYDASRVGYATCPESVSVDVTRPRIRSSEAACERSSARGASATEATNSNRPRPASCSQEPVAEENTTGRVFDSLNACSAITSGTVVLASLAARLRRGDE